MTETTGARGANQPLQRLVRMALLVRYSLLGAGIVFFLAHLVQHGWLGEPVTAADVTEVFLVSAVQPGLLWVFSLWAERLARDVERHSSELTALNQITQQVLSRSAETQEELEITRRHLRLLGRVYPLALQGLPTVEVLKGSLDYLLETMGLEAAEIWILEPTSQRLTQLCHRGFAPEAFQEMLSFPVGEGFPGRAVQTRAPVFSVDLVRDARFLRAKVLEAGFNCYGAVPLFSGERVVGALAAGSRRFWWRSSSQVEALVTVGRVLGSLLEGLATTNSENE